MTNFLYWLTADFLRRFFYKETVHVAQIYFVFRTLSRISPISIKIIVSFRPSRDRFGQIRNERYALNIFEPNRFLLRLIHCKDQFT